MRSFFVRVITIGVFLHAYVGFRLIPALPGNVIVHTALALWLVFSCLIVPLGMLRRDGGARGLRAFATWVGLLEMGFFSFLLTLTLIRDVLLLIYAIIAATPFAFATTLQTALPIPVVVRSSAETVLALALLMLLSGVYNARRRAPVVDIEIPIQDLPAAWHGFTIAQLSDIHVGPTIRKRYLDPIVDAVNGLDADMVAITGDIVDGSVAALKIHTAPLSRLKAKHGVFLVTGNHEYYAGADAWVTEFRRLGLQVLMNEHVVLTRGESSLVLGGVTDYNASHFSSKHKSDPVKAMSGAPADAALRVLLAHQPRSGKAAEAAGFDVQLSGHTHGGQFFPWNFAVRVQQPFTAGLVRSGRMWMYISRGTGYWGPPVRFAAPSEITRIRLVQAKNA
ncbi:metallophosphoesterase [Robbsia andropogonis]|uniref:metallophosphoesterase n=1 Tax=Robbsia andropogonis TaxID=28092 RepID=UPI003D25547D